DAAVWMSSAELSGDRLKRRIGSNCSHDCGVKRRVPLTDLTAGCAVGRDAAGASSRQKGRRRDMWRTAFLRRRGLGAFGRVEWRQIETPYRKQLLARR
ncbi:MAG: hypothetical protein NT069_01865, partial [Planctomycetota bacterium]|nr:hypothetical protein [Planctomycetota bacterium]